MGRETEERKDRRAYYCDGQLGPRHSEAFLRNCALCISEVFLLRTGSWDIHPSISDPHCLWFSPGGGPRVPSTWAPPAPEKVQRLCHFLLEKISAAHEIPIDLHFHSLFPTQGTQNLWPSSWHLFHNILHSLLECFKPSCLIP